MQSWNEPDQTTRHSVTRNTRGKTEGLRVHCDPAGNITQILNLNIRAGSTPTVGQALGSWVDSASRDKFEQFLAAIKTDGSAFGWQINAGAQTDVSHFDFSGFAVSDGILIVAARNRDSDLYDSLMQINNELARLQREIAQKNVALEHEIAERIQAEERLRNVIANNIDGMIVVDHAGIIRFINPSATILLNKPQTDLEGCLFGLPITQTDGSEIEIELVRPNQELYPAEMRVTEIIWATQPAYLVSLRDITQRKRLEEQLRRQAKSRQRTTKTKRTRARK